ncbi:MAG: acyl-ACP--UDP-N-acetylglucosamine O-acyltransferase [Acidobacteria bacterium]|nr:acyl-ACP--UDP-N-acetylglucosamine O-acyltransferase [Acidobacteriota bacterium]MCI0626206.1 acyl-ACP--UDP-N-acetylglucosamine O-acyltransferase [Acidobacteriota bacterium]MCI0718023.1 acyl-ACP--UDP-N-acetylglucosamine O-acyltransferase [Acidobacteriota bacterium]
MSIHPTAVISADASLAGDVSLGAYSIVGAGVVLGAGCRVDEHVVIQGPSRIGQRCRFFPFGSIGLPAQDLKYKGEPAELIVGDDNIFREYVTVHRGTAQGGGRTILGNHNYAMAYSHIAHDCILGNHIILANAATLAGHVTIADHATIGAFSGIHQFCKVGLHGFVGGYSVITKDVLPYSKTVSAREAGNYGVNTIGLERNGFSPESIKNIRAAFRVILQSKLNTAQALAALKQRFDGDPDVRPIIEFIEKSERGIIK